MSELYICAAIIAFTLLVVYVFWPSQSQTVAVKPSQPHVLLREEGVHHRTYLIHGVSRVSPELLSLKRIPAIGAPYSPRRQHDRVYSKEFTRIGPNLIQAVVTYRPLLAPTNSTN